MLALLAKGARPAQLDQVLSVGNGLHSGTGDEILKHLVRQPKSELEYANVALRAEAMDGGHALLRHGPQVPDEALKRRLLSGITPGDVASTGPGSTRFRSFEAFVATRKRALDALKARGLKREFGPGAGGNDLEPLTRVTIDHGKSISRGYVKTGPWVEVEDIRLPESARAAAPKVWAFASAVREDEAVTRVFTKVDWDGKRWRVVQHFPTASSLDLTTGRYAEDATVWLRRR